MKWCELRNPQDLNLMGSKVYDLGLSRQELYDLYGVLLLIEKLEKVMSYDVSPQSNAIDQQQTEGKGKQLPIPKAINTIRAQKYFQKAIEKGYIKVENGLFKWVGVKQRRNGTPNMSELAYFLGKVYEYKYSNNGNIGKSFPDKELEKLFNIKQLMYNHGDNLLTICFKINTHHLW